MAACRACCRAIPRPFLARSTAPSFNHRQHPCFAPHPTPGRRSRGLLLGAPRRGLADALWSEEELTEQSVRGSGPGGQKINKTSSCVLLTHQPTGTTVRCQRTRSQAENRRIARKMLQEKLEVLTLGEESKAMKRVQRLKKRKKRRRRRSVARHSAAGEPGAVALRAAAAADRAFIERVAAEVVEAGEFYPQTSVEQMMSLWNSGTQFVAEQDGELVGSFCLKPNQAGRGDHTANAGYMTAEEHKGKGVGRAMAEHSLEAARAAGFRAMQFNYVVETNTSAIALWQSVGFEIVGRAPDAFRRPSGELVAVLMMHRAL